MEASCASGKPRTQSSQGWLANLTGFSWITSSLAIQCCGLWLPDILTGCGWLEFPVLHESAPVPTCLALLFMTAGIVTGGGCLASSVLMGQLLSRLQQPSLCTHQLYQARQLEKPVSLIVLSCLYSYTMFGVTATEWWIRPWITSMATTFEKPEWVKSDYTDAQNPQNSSPFRIFNSGEPA